MAKTSPILDALGKYRESRIRPSLLPSQMHPRCRTTNDLALAARVTVRI